MPAPSKPRRWFRFSLRTLFVAVTVIAVALVLWQRASSLRASASRHRREASQHGNFGFYATKRGTNKATPQFQQNYKYHLELQAWHLNMATRSERLIWQPWFAFTAPPAEPTSPFDQVNQDKK